MGRFGVQALHAFGGQKRRQARRKGLKADHLAAGRLLLCSLGVAEIDQQKGAVLGDKQSALAVKEARKIADVYLVGHKCRFAAAQKAAQVIYSFFE